MTALALQAPAPSLHPATPSIETVRDFLTAAEALMAKGADGVRTPEADAVRQAVQDAARAYRAALAESASRGEAAMMASAFLAGSAMKTGGVATPTRTKPWRWME